MPRFARFLFLVALLQVAACDSAAERKAQEEAAITAGDLRPVDVVAGTAKVSDSAAKAAAVEAAASAPDHPALAALPPQGEVTDDARAEIQGVVADIDCRPDISADECAAAKASLAGDMHAMLDEKAALCAQARVRAESAQRKLVAQSTDLNADLEAASQEHTRSRDFLLANCAP